MVWRPAAAARRRRGRTAPAAESLGQIFFAARIGSQFVRRDARPRLLGRQRHSGRPTERSERLPASIQRRSSPPFTALRLCRTPRGADAPSTPNPKPATVARLSATLTASKGGPFRTVAGPSMMPRSTSCPGGPETGRLERPPPAAHPLGGLRRRRGVIRALRVTAKLRLQGSALAAALASPGRELGPRRRLVSHRAPATRRGCRSSTSRSSR